MKKMTLIGLAAALTVTTLTAVAQVKPFEAIEYRQGVFKAVKWNFGPMAEMVRGKQEFNAEEFTRRAENVAALSKLPLEAFVAGTYASKTAALPIIEKDYKTFSDMMANFEKASAALAVAAKSGDLAQIRPAFGEVGKTCKSCHDKFRD